MSEDGTLGRFRLVQDPTTRWNFEQIERLALGRAPAQARVFHSAAQAITTATTTALAFNSEDYDTGNFHDNATNNTRLTAPTAGLYLVEVFVEWAANATGHRRTLIRKNGAATSFWGGIDAFPIAGVTCFAQAFALLRLVAGDYVEALVRQTSGGNLDVTAANGSPTFSIVRLGSQA